MALAHQEDRWRPYTRLRRVYEKREEIRDKEGVGGGLEGQHEVHGAREGLSLFSLHTRTRMRVRARPCARIMRGHTRGYAKSKN